MVERPVELKPEPAPLKEEKQVVEEPVIIPVVEKPEPVVVKEEVIAPKVETPEKVEAPKVELPEVEIPKLLKLLSKSLWKRRKKKLHLHRLWK